MSAVILPSEELQPLAQRIVSEHEAVGKAEAAVVCERLGAALHKPLLDFLARPGKEFRARLCERAFRLAGGSARGMPRELPLALEALHAGSLIIDDIEDGSLERRGAPALHQLAGTPVALNAGNWLYFWPQRLIGQCGFSAHVRLQLLERMGECLLSCHEGQALDLTVHVDRLPRQEVPVVMQALGARKTGALMGLSGAFGAIAAGAEPELVQALDRFGAALGVGLQMLDDLSGVLNPARRDKGIEDLLNGRVTWVWAWLAEDLGDTDYEALLRTRARVAAATDADREAALDTLLGALRFRLGVIGPRRARRHLEQALEALCQLTDAQPYRAELDRELRWLERKFLEA